MKIKFKLEKLMRVHDAVRDHIWAFATKENPPAEKLFLIYQ